MPTYVAFLRAVNVGGRMVKMAALRERLVDAGFTEVETYIASGNVKVKTGLRSSSKVAAELERVMGEWLGFDVPTMVRTPKELRDLHAAGSTLDNPLGQESRHWVAFLRDAPSPDATERLHAWDEPLERATVVGREAHLWLASERPKLTNTRMEKLLGTIGTARDWKTVTKLTDSWT